MRIGFVCLAIALLALAACGPKLFQPQEHTALVAVSSKAQSLDLSLKKGQKLESLKVYILQKTKNMPHASAAHAVTQALTKALQEQGYSIVTQPSLASCIILVDSPYFGYVSQVQVESIANAPYGSPLPAVIESAKGTRAERILLTTDIHVALRTPQKRVRRHAPVVTTASHKSVLTEDSVRLAIMTTESGFVKDDVRESLASQLATEIVRQMPRL